MKTTAILLLFLSACSPKPVTKPELKMAYADFGILCGFAPDDSKTVTTDKGETHTVTINRTNWNGEPHKPDCVGTFTFVDDKLTSIER